MTHHFSIMIEGKMYNIFAQFKLKADAKVRADLARATGMFESVRVIEIDRVSSLYKYGKWALAMRGAKPGHENITAEELITKSGLPKKMGF